MWKLIKALPKSWRWQYGAVGCNPPSEDAESATKAECQTKPNPTASRTLLAVCGENSGTNVIPVLQDVSYGPSGKLIPQGKRVSSGGEWRVPNWESSSIFEALGVGFALLVGLRYGLRSGVGRQKDEKEKSHPPLHPCCPLSALLRLAHAVNRENLFLRVLPDATLNKTGRVQEGVVESRENGSSPESAADSTTNKDGSVFPTLSPTISEENEETILLSMRKLDNEFIAQSLNLEAQDLLKRRRPQEAFEKFEEASSLGLDSAIFNLGVCYESGLGVDEDLHLALELYEEAASRGHGAALYNMAVFHLEGRGVAIDERLGLLCMEKACTAGVREAQTFMGLYHGKNNEYEKAAVLFHKAAQQKDADGQYFLGLCYENGLGVEENAAKAANLFARAAEANNMEAHYRLAIFYELGLGGLIEDKAQAICHYEIAARANHPMASLRLEQDLHKTEYKEPQQSNAKPLRSVSSSPNLSSPKETVIVGSPEGTPTNYQSVFDFTKVKQFIHDYLSQPATLNLYRLHLNMDDSECKYGDVDCTPVLHEDLDNPIKAW